jgi:WD40 repeat protein
MADQRLPTVIATSVIRSAEKGDSHGGVYLIDLETEEQTQVIDWDTVDIDWAGRGKDRGLRGIAFHDGLVYIAASNEIFVYDPDFNLVRTITNAYLNHCHEICIANGILYLSSTGFDSILCYDLKEQAFTQAYCLRFRKVNNSGATESENADSNLKPIFLRYNPNLPKGPGKGDMLHINNVWAEGDEIYFSASWLSYCFRIQEHQLQTYGKIPNYTHNVTPHAKGLLYNNTNNDAVTFGSPEGQVIREFEIPLYPESDLERNDIPDDHARQGFGRGLCTSGPYIIGGSSPATISIYDFESGKRIKQVNLTMDIRNAIHGLEVWPF